MNQAVIKPRPWNTPFWFMMGMFIFVCLQTLVRFELVGRASLNLTLEEIAFVFLLWPLILLAETVIYWVIRRKIKERKWVWAHLLFSSAAFVLLAILRIFFVFISFNYSGRDAATPFRLMNTIEFYGFWSCIIFGHVFFIIAIVQSFSKNNAPLPDDNNDFLSELPG